MDDKRSCSTAAAVIIGLALAFAAAGGAAKEAEPAAAEPALEARMLAITAELRCLVCQNQTIADSHSGLADDLRREVREQLRKGSTDAQIVQYMTDRYGDFVRYRPPFKASTALLWVGPAVLLLGGIAVLLTVLRRRQKLAADAFEPDDFDQLELADQQAPGLPPDAQR
jgi:cytochrome c-type biogenesis protein CcmH